MDTEEIFVVEDELTGLIEELEDLVVVDVDEAYATGLTVVEVSFSVVVEVVEVTTPYPEGCKVISQYLTHGVQLNLRRRRLVQRRSQRRGVPERMSSFWNARYSQIRFD